MDNPTNDLPNFRVLSERGETIYRGLDKAIIDENIGKYIAIEFHADEYFIGNTREDAVAKAKAKYPQNLVFVRRIGPIENLSRHINLSLARI